MKIKRKIALCLVGLMTLTSLNSVFADTEAEAKAKAKTIIDLVRAGTKYSEEYKDYDLFKDEKLNSTDAAIAIKKFLNPYYDVEDSTESTTEGGSTSGGEGETSETSTSISEDSSESTTEGGNASGGEGETSSSNETSSETTSSETSSSETSSETTSSETSSESTSEASTISIEGTEARDDSDTNVYSCDKISISGADDDEEIEILYFTEDPTNEDGDVDPDKAESTKGSITVADGGFDLSADAIFDAIDGLFAGDDAEDTEDDLESVWIVAVVTPEDGDAIYSNPIELTRAYKQEITLKIGSTEAGSMQDTDKPFEGLALANQVKVNPDPDGLAKSSFTGSTDLTANVTFYLSALDDTDNSLALANGLDEDFELDDGEDPPVVTVKAAEAPSTPAGS